MTIDSIGRLTFWLMTKRVVHVSKRKTWMVCRRGTTTERLDGDNANLEMKLCRGWFMENAAHIKAVIRTFKRKEGAVLKSKCEDGGLMKRKRSDLTPFISPGWEMFGNVRVMVFMKLMVLFNYERKKKCSPNDFGAFVMPPLRSMIN